MSSEQYELIRQNYPELRLPRFYALDDPYLAIVSRHTPDEVVAKRAAYLLSRESPATYDMWEIDVPF